MVLPKTTVIVPVCAILFGCGIVGVSLVRAADTLPNASAESTTVSIASHFQERIVTGHPLYPFRVMINKAEVLFAGAEHRDARKLQIARQRLSDAQNLVDRGQFGRAAQTVIKGQLYVTSCLQVEEKVNDDQHRAALLSVLDQYQIFIQTQKDRFSDEQKALLDRALIENEMYRERL